MYNIVLKLFKIVFFKIWSIKEFVIPPSLKRRLPSMTMEKKSDLYFFSSDYGSVYSVHIGCQIIRRIKNKKVILFFFFALDLTTNSLHPPPSYPHTHTISYLCYCDKVLSLINFRSINLNT